MNHVTADLAAFRAGELSPRAAARVEEHLASCAACRAELAGLTNLWGLLGEVNQPAAPADSVWPQVRARTIHADSRPLPALGWAMAALVAGVLIGVTWPGSVPVSGHGQVAMTNSTDNTWLESSWLENGQGYDLASGWLLVGDQTNEDGS